MLAYADPRAYTDRLNALFTVRGWTRRYAVETINNVERKLSNGTQIAGKVVVTCEVTIHGLGTHSGIGEEWAENENAGTAAEAQAFKRACSCFRLGRYLYDLDGTWVDLDERKQPKRFRTARLGTAETETRREPTGEAGANQTGCSKRRSPALEPRSNQAAREEPVGTGGIQSRAFVEHRDCRCGDRWRRLTASACSRRSQTELGGYPRRGVETPARGHRRCRPGEVLVQICRVLETSPATPWMPSPTARDYGN